MTYRVRDWLYARHARALPVPQLPSADAFDDSVQYFRDKFPELYERVDKLVAKRQWRECASSRCESGFWTTNPRQKYCTSRCQRLAQSRRHYRRRRAA